MASIAATCSFVIPWLGLRLGMTNAWVEHCEPRAAFAAYSRIQRFVSQRATSNVDRGMIAGLFEMVNSAAEPRALSASLLACRNADPTQTGRKFRGCSDLSCSNADQTQTGRIFRGGRLTRRVEERPTLSH
jgi:hypothetical protein